MTEQTTPLEKLQLNGRYYRCLIRHGYTTIEQIENYLSDKNAEPLSKILPTCPLVEITKLQTLFIITGPGNICHVHPESMP